MSVHALAKSTSHEFSKTPVAAFTLVAGHGVEDDCHSGVHVQHRSRLHIQPPPPNLRQVHLIPKEVLDEFGVAPGQIGENVTTVGVDLLALGAGAKLRFVPADADNSEVPADGTTPTVVVQGLRNPCPQIDKFQSGLREKFIVRDGEGRIATRKSGVMGTVEVGGPVEVGMKIVVESSDNFQALACV
ncbi:pyruvate kinase-like protein [Lasiosphaeria ovina]|uniref:Pyruvate kinase-like protein n=1 Tax=Lasiosphaeria ovina TaxID=92902 RepID=A0AAE0NA06_9PEZI|nr:pyruvate kinase-like protein [Lasiosphaeria ovina]